MFEKDKTLRQLSYITCKRPYSSNIETLGQLSSY